jgi:Multidrug resistance efflux pump
MSALSLRSSMALSPASLLISETGKKGQVLLYVNSPDVAESQSNYYDALSKVTKAQAEIELVKIRLEIAFKDINRLNDLVSEGISSKRDLESSQARCAATEAELVALDAAAKAAEAQLAAARVRLAALGIAKPSPTPSGFTSEPPLLSPRDGIVVQRNVIAGQVFLLLLPILLKLWRLTMPLAQQAMPYSQSPIWIRFGSCWKYLSPK